MGRRIRWLGTPGGALQKCSECDNKTRYWQPEAAVPLCSACAGKYQCEASENCQCQWCIARRKVKEERDAATAAKAGSDPQSGG